MGFRVGCLSVAIMAALAGVAAGQCAPGWMPQGPEGFVWGACAWDPDGSGPLGQRVVVGGAFGRAMHLVTSNVVAVDPANGAWTPMGMGVNGAVNAVAGGPDGSLYVAGGFSAAGGVPAANIAKWNEATKTWSALGSGLDSGAMAVHVMPDGDVIAGGEFWHAGGQPASRVARWDAQTQTWGPMASDVDWEVFAITSLPDGDVVIGGWFTRVENQQVSMVARWDAQTDTWGDLGGGVDGHIGAVYDLETMPDGDVVAAGGFATAGGVPAPSLARWDSQTNTWSSVGGGISGEEGTAYAVTRAADDDLIVVGLFTRAGTVTVSNAARWDAATNTWSGVSNVGNGGVGVRAVAATADGRVVLGGSFTGRNANALPGFDHVAMLYPGANAASPTSPLVVNGRINDVARGPRGDVHLNSFADVVSGWTGVRFVRRNAATMGLEALSTLPSNGIAGNNLAVAGDESVLWLRTPSWVLEASQPGIGEQIGSWVWPTNNSAAFTRMRNGDVLASGWGATTIGGVAVNGMARWNPATQTWSAFAPVGNPSVTTTVTSLLETRDGSVWALASIPAATTIWRWDAATGAWAERDHGIDGLDTHMAEAPDGDILVVGGLNDGSNGRYVTRWDAQTGVWQRYPNLETTSTAGTRGLHVGPDGSIFVAAFLPEGFVFRYNPTTQAWDSLLTASGTLSEISSMPNGDFEIVHAGERWIASGAPWIVEQPRTMTVAEGETLVLRASPSDGYTGATVRWQRNGVDIANGAGGASAGGGVVSGATAALAIPTDNSVAELVITGAQLSDAGVYRAIITCPCGSVTTTDATVTVEQNPCPCPADVDCSGGVDSDDVIVFFAAWDQNLGSADFNGDGGVDADDVIAFFGRWDSGC